MCHLPWVPGHPVEIFFRKLLILSTKLLQAVSAGDTLRACHLERLRAIPLERESERESKDPENVPIEMPIRGVLPKLPVLGFSDHARPPDA